MEGCKMDKNMNTCYEDFIESSVLRFVINKGDHNLISSSFNKKQLRAGKSNSRIT